MYQNGQYVFQDLCTKKKLYKSRLLSDENLEFLNEQIISNRVEIYVDGSCEINNSENPCTYGVIVVEEGKVIWEGGGMFEVGTNNIGELMALIIAVQIAIFLKDDYNIKSTIFSDSRYAINSLLYWSKEWVKKGSKKSNMGLMKTFHELDNPLRFQNNVRWIKGHNGNKFNEMVDELCLKYY